MNVISVLHNKALEFADEATIAKHKGNLQTARELFLKAFQLEKEAALKAPLMDSDMVPRHVLIRSAASLAMLSEQFEEAEQLILLGLTSSPPDFIKEELSDLAKEISKRKPIKSQDQFVQLIGLFIYANANENQIKIQDSNQPYSYTLIAPSEVIQDIVKKYFLEKVSITASVSTNGILLMREMKVAA